MNVLIALKFIAIFLFSGIFFFQLVRFIGTNIFHFSDVCKHLSKSKQEK